MFRRLNEFLALTKNEQRVFLLLVAVLLSGIAIHVYKRYVRHDEGPRFDYRAADSVFAARSHAPDSAAAVPDPAAKIDLNRATKSELMSLPGIGETTAERILLARQERGRFRSVRDLRSVKGIGEKKLEKLIPYIEVQ